MVPLSPQIYGNYNSTLTIHAKIVNYEKNSG
jgi:hypothetical protein